MEAPGDRAAREQPAAHLPSDPGWSIPSPYGAPEALAALSTTAAPLLAGFSITFIGLLLQGQDVSRYPGVALLLLSLATVGLLYCVQCGFWARHFLATPDMVAQWYDDYASNANRRAVIHREQRRGYAAYAAWARRARRSYSWAIVSLLGGMALTLLPTRIGPETSLQTASAVVFFCAAVAEILWAIYASGPGGSLPRRVREWLSRPSAQ